MHKFDKTEWRRAKNRERSDRLLDKYCLKRRGITFAEAKVLDDPYPAPREIDGVRFSSRVRKLKTWSPEDDAEFQEELSRARRNRRPVEIIEVITPNIDRGVIGQVMVGAWLLEEQGVKVKMTVVCPTVGVALKKLLKKHGIEVWTPS